MAYSKTYRTIVPVLHSGNEDQDHALARWLARESFELTAASEGLELGEYTERDVDPADIPPKAAEALGRPLTDYHWFEFSGVGRLNQTLFDWCAAECLYNYQAWLDAEAAWLESQKAADAQSV